MGLFNGILSLGSTSPHVGDTPLFLPFNVTGVGHVLDVILSTDHPSYDPTKNRVVGTILYRDALKASGTGGSSPEAFMEALETVHANPLDRSNFKVPLPGEQVLIYRAKSSKLDGPNETLSTQWYYGSVVNMTQNLTANVSPFIGIDPSSINPLLPAIRTFGDLSTRFDKKIKNLALFKQTNGKPIVHKQLQLNEGDFILQGRFGGSIRFAGTPADTEASKQQWTENKVGAPGDPILMMRLSNTKGKYDDLEKTLYETEDIQQDAASLYLTTTQQIPIELAIPNKGDKTHSLASWAYVNGIEIGLGVDAVNTAGRARDGEAARSGRDKQSAKEAGTDGDYRQSDTSGDQESSQTPDEGPTQ